MSHWQVRCDRCGHESSRDSYIAALGDAREHEDAHVSHSCEICGRPSGLVATVSVLVTLSEDACQHALHARHMRLALEQLAWVKIENTMVDRSRGDDRACRHLILNPEEAQALGDYYRQSAEVFTTAGDSERARACAGAETIVWHALLTAASLLGAEQTERRTPMR
jgi:hypothetical protein